MKIAYLLLLLPTLVYSKNISYNGIIEQDQRVTIQNTYSYALDRLNQRKLPLDNVYYNGKYIGKGIDVYIIDTGISENIYYNFTCGYNFIGNPCDCSTSHYHGTHVGSLVASTLFGTAPGSTIINLRVLDDNGNGHISNVIGAIDYLLEKNVTCSIINMSIGGGKSQILNLKVKELTMAGNRVVVAAGNFGSNACNYSPSSEKSAITVGSVDRYDKKPYFTNRGKCVDVYAPGKSIIGVLGYNTIGYVSGTSMSSPLIAGVLASKMEESGCDARIPKIKLKKRFKLGYFGK